EIRKAQYQDRARGFQPRCRHAGRTVRRQPPDPAAIHPAGQERAEPECPGGAAELPVDVLRLKTTRPMVADKRVREAMNIAITRADIVKGIMLGNAEPAYTYIDDKALAFAST